MKKENMLNDEQLDAISGGYVFNNSGINGADHNYPWEVLDGKGDVVGRFKNYDEAVNNAKMMGQDPTAIDWDKVCELRSHR